MKVLVGSHNPTKVEAVQKAFACYFGHEITIVARSVESHVSHQPINDETFAGARNRALELNRLNQTENLGASYCVGIEAGIIQLYSVWYAFSAVCIMDDRDRLGWGVTPMWELPPHIAQELLGGVELGDVMDRLMGEQNTKQKGGAVAYFTHGITNRKTIYTQAVTLALIPFVNAQHYFGDQA
jgi:inosine/xanthosine triphosphatase